MRKEKAYKEIDDDDDEEEEEEGEDLEQSQRGAGPSSRQGRKRQFSSEWVNKEEVDKELMESQKSPSPLPVSLAFVWQYCKWVQYCSSKFVL